MSEPASTPAQKLAARRGAKAPQDHKTAVATARHQEADGEESIVTVQWEGLELTCYGDNITGETLEELETGNIHKAVRALLGPEQWAQVKVFPIRKIGELFKLWGAAAGQGNS